LKASDQVKPERFPKAHGSDVEVQVNDHGPDQAFGGALVWPKAGRAVGEVHRLLRSA